MSRRKYVVVTATDSEDDAEAFGPFSTGHAANVFAEAYEEEGVRPAYGTIVLELIPVREGLAAIREAKAENDA